jgi:voltage-gated potassium channel
MTGPMPRQPLRRGLRKRILSGGLTPRFAAGVIALAWAFAVVLFGVVEYLVDKESFGSVWMGMWWAMQTVTTVGYGDVVPGQTSGKVIATFLMLGGLSLFAVVTGAITSAFVAQAQARFRAEEEDPVVTRLDELATQLESVRAELAELRRPRE